MAFTLERFDINKQNHDKTGIYFYHDTVGKAATDPTSKQEGNSLAEIIADNFFNPVAEELQIPGGVIIVSATDGVGLYKVTQVYDNDKKPAVKIAAMAVGAAADARIGTMTDLTTDAKDTIVNAINEIDEAVDTLTTSVGELEARKAALVADSTAEDAAGLVTDFNGLLAALKAAGLMAQE